MRDSSGTKRLLRRLRLIATTFAFGLASGGCVIVTEHPVDSTPPTPPSKANASKLAPSASATPVAAAPASAGSSDAKPLPKPNTTK